MELCAICRENHEPGRGLSFDGHGVNDCGMYRSRLATFSQSRKRDKIGFVFAASPELLTACRAALALIQDPDAEPADADRVESILLAAIARAEGQ